MRAALAVFLVLGLAASASALPFGLSVPSWFSSRLSGYRSAAQAPLLWSMDSQVIPDHYIVVLKDAATLDVHLATMSLFLAPKPSHRGLKNVFKIKDHAGYMVHVDENALEDIRKHPDVAYVERDQIVHAYDVERNVPSWGIARISYRKKPTPKQYKTYTYDSHAGAGVTAYVIDTGVNIKHQDFEGRAIWGKTIPEGDEDADGNGHGTHVAGTVAGLTFGVAKKATIKAVKVLRSNGSGTLSDVIKGIEWAVTDHEERVKEAALADEKAAEAARREGKEAPAKTKVKSTANMSLGGGRSKVLDRAVDAAVEAGIHFAVAAGNDARDACQYSPAASQNAVTVGASSIDDSMAWFSNHGKCVDVFGPGKDITSAWIGSTVATNTISGTSMASPHVAGLLTLFLSQPQHEDKTPKELKDFVIELSSKGMVTGLPIWSKTANRLIYNDPPAGDAKPPKPSPPSDGDDEEIIF